MIVQTELVVIVCPTCGATFAMPRQFYAHCHEHGKWYCCPKGHWLFSKAEGAARAGQPPHDHHDAIQAEKLRDRWYDECMALRAELDALKEDIAREAIQSIPVEERLQLEGLPAGIRAFCRKHKLYSKREVRELADLELLSLHGCGKKTLAVLREKSK